jgi:hypothetical protein
MQIELTNAFGQSLSVNYSSTNVHICDSHTVNKAEVAGWVKLIKETGNQNGYVYPRSESSWIREWKAHNVLFKWSICPDRTKDVDLEFKVKFLYKIGYFILSLM